MYGTLPHSATRPLKTYSTAVRAIPLSVCHQGPPSGNRTGFKKCSDAQQFIQLTVVDDINVKSGWRLKTETLDEWRNGDETEGWNEKQNHRENAERFTIYIFLHQKWKQCLEFGWCLQFKQSCLWATLSYFCLRKQGRKINAMRRVVFEKFIKKSSALSHVVFGTWLGQDQDYLGGIPRVVVQISALTLKGPL